MRIFVISRYDSFFEEDFSVTVSPDHDAYNKKRMAFFKDGLAIYGRSGDSFYPLGPGDNHSFRKP